MLYIDSVNFKYGMLYEDNVIVDSVVTDVVIEYHVEVKGNEVDAETTIDFEQYKDMKYQEVINYLTKAFNETVKAIE